MSRRGGCVGTRGFAAWHSRRETAGSSSVAPVTRAYPDSTCTDHSSIHFGGERLREIAERGTRLLLPEDAQRLASHTNTATI